MDKQLLKSAVRNAVGVVAYILVVAWFINTAPKVFGTDDKLGPLGFAMLLMIFVVSALTTGGLVLWQPAKLLVDGKKKEAGVLLGLTGGALFLAVIITIVIIALTH